jgi:amidase
MQQSKHSSPRGVRSNPNLPSRRAVLGAGVAAGAAGVAALSGGPPLADESTRATTAGEDFELAELSIDELRGGLESGRFTARSLVERYLERIETIDRAGPKLGAVIETNPDALAIAEALDAERKSKGPRGPLHGIPVLVKDNCDTADKMATTAGSLALVGAKPPSDSFVVRQLRAAGALIIGKSNLSEWSNIRSKNSTSGWSGRGGQTRNPYALDRNPCGSSSGSAAGVAANLCAAAVGTETDGSILCPASVCGVVGVKPTVGLVSRTGIIPISQSQDTAGPIARTVRDAAILLGGLVGVDPEDAVTAESAKHAAADYAQSLDAAALKGAKIGVARNFFGFHDGVERLMAEALAALEDAGATLVDAEGLAVVDQAGGAEGTVFRYELKAGLAAYFARLGDGAPVKSLADVIEFNRQHHDEELRYFGQDFFESSVDKGPLTEYEYVEALAKCRRLARTEGIDRTLDQHGLEAIVAPTMGPACTTDLVNGDHWLGGSTSPAAIAGYPSVTVPAGFVHGLPVGLSFIGRAWSEAALLRLAYAFEQATRQRRPPRLLATAGL